ncbi:MAG: Rv2175c family DNA-binding protein [Mycobacteriales bacterium]
MADGGELGGLLAGVEWLTLPDVATRLGLEVTRVRQLLRDGALLAVRGEDGVLRVPGELLAGDSVVKGLPGTITLLRDNGFDDAAAVRWLFTEDESLPGAPVRALAANRGREVKRRAQALGF